VRVLVGEVEVPLRGVGPALDHALQHRLAARRLTQRKEEPPPRADHRPREGLALLRELLEPRVDELKAATRALGVARRLVAEVELEVLKPVREHLTAREHPLGLRDGSDGRREASSQEVPDAPPPVASLRDAVVLDVEVALLHQVVEHLRGGPLRQEALPQHAGGHAEEVQLLPPAGDRVPRAPHVRDRPRGGARLREREEVRASVRDPVGAELLLDLLGGPRGELREGPVVAQVALDRGAELGVSEEPRVLGEPRRAVRREVVRLYEGVTRQRRHAHHPRAVGDPFDEVDARRAARVRERVRHDGARGRRGGERRRTRGGLVLREATFLVLLAAVARAGVITTGTLGAC
jgi:hypothetical protein